MATEPYRIESTDHIGITVSSLDAAVGFFSVLLGKEPTLRRIYDDRYISEVTGVSEARLDVAYFDLPGGSRLELLEYQNERRSPAVDPAVPGSAHLSMRVDSIEPALQRAMDAGAVAVGHQLVLITSGPNAGGKMVYLRTPGDVIIELFQRGEPHIATAEPLIAE